MIGYLFKQAITKIPNTLKSSLMLMAILAVCACTKQSKEPSNQTNDISIITPDWSIASTLTAIDTPPVATGDLRMLPEWSLSPKMPTTTLDLGQRYTPNPELLAQLSAELFIYSSFYSHLANMDNMATWEYKGVNKKDTPPTWNEYQAAVLEIGKQIHKEQQTLEYINHTATYLAQKGVEFKQQHPNIKRLAIVQFGNANQLYNYTSSSPFGPALDKMGIDIVNLGKSSEWGSYITDISEISRLDDDTCLIIIKPFSTLLKKELSKHALWQYLGYGSGKRCAMIIEPVWAFGDFPSMVGLADNLLTATPYTKYGINTDIYGKNTVGAKL